MTFRLKHAHFLLFVFLLFSCRSSQVDNAGLPEIPADSTGNNTESSFVLFGIPSDSFNLVSGRIRPNSYLSSLLAEAAFRCKDIDHVTRNFRDVFDTRKIKAGNSYTLFCDKDTIGRARYLVYEHDPVTCYIFSFNDSLNIVPYHRTINSTVRYASGTIENSLWVTMMEKGLHPSLTVKLSEIYAWTVDFFGLQKGDSFKVIYEELAIDTNSLGAGRVFGAQFTWAGKTITAIPFIQDSTESYYDNDGNSLRKAFLKAPLQFSRVTSRFSSSRMHPILRIRRPHYGVDYAAPVGTPVLAIGDGRVSQTSYEGGSGRMVRITHNSVYSTAYLHLSRFGKGIEPGVWVKQGDVIGYVGSTGLSTGPHLDFRFYMNGSPVDPLKVEAPPVEPVSEKNLERFRMIRNTVNLLLETI